jgi:nucleoside phosphorylase
MEVHRDRVEIARYLLSRGLDSTTAVPREDVLAAASQAGAAVALQFPQDLAPSRQAFDPQPAPDDPLPRADAVVITWTVDELAGLSKVFVPGFADTKYWIKYARNFSQYEPHIRSTAPAAHSQRLGSYQLATVGGLKVLLFKSELHLNQDGKSQGDGLSTLPVKDLFLQIIDEVQPAHVLTVGTAGSVFDAFGLGDAVITRSAKFRLQQEFKNEPYNGHKYKSEWTYSTRWLSTGEQLMSQFRPQLAVPPFALPTDQVPLPGGPIAMPEPTPKIRIEQDARDMPEFHPILTTDYFEYGTTVNRLDHEGAAVEMGDAALGLACSELQHPPHWLVVRNMSDPVINGELPAKQFHLNEQTTWAVAYYTAYGEWTSATGALAAWAVLAGIASP